MRVQKTQNDQYIVTIPKAFAEMLGYSRGTILEFNLAPDMSLILKHVKSAHKATRMRVQITPNNQYIITIPKVLAESFGYDQGTLVVFRIDSEMNLTLHKKE